MPSFGQLLLTRIAGDSINYLTSTANLGGEFFRVRMLQGQTAVAPLVASVIVAKLTQTIGLFAFIGVGLVLVVDDTRIPGSVRWGILGGLLCFAVVLAGLLIMQRRGLLAPALRFTDRWPAVRFLAPLRSCIEQIDAEMARTHRESTGQIVLSSASFAVGYGAGIVESYLILWFFGVPVSLELALSIEILGVMLNNLMFFVPRVSEPKKRAKFWCSRCSDSIPRRGWQPVLSAEFANSPGPSSDLPSWPDFAFVRKLFHCHRKAHRRSARSRQKTALEQRHPAQRH